MSVNWATTHPPIVVPVILACALSVLSSCGASDSALKTSFRAATTASGTLRDAAANQGIIVGSAANTNALNDSEYSTVLGDEFSQLEPEWEMKFATVHPRPGTDPLPYDFSLSDRLVDYALLHHMQVRGHTLFWYQALPDWLENGRYTQAQLSAIAKDHISTVLQHFGTSVYAWDVVNEAFNDDGSLRSSVWFNQPGIGYAGRGTKYIEQALVWSRAANPEVKLFYNDGGAETENRKSDAIYAMAADFKHRGVPLDGVGFQMHLDLSSDSDQWAASVERNLKRFSDLGLEIHITELDIRLSHEMENDLNAQAELYARVAELCLANPTCKVLQTWGFTDKYSWISDSYYGMGWALPWDAAYGKKPAYYALHQAFAK